MTYNDAEFVAIRLVRLAKVEDGQAFKLQEMTEVIQDTMARHGESGIVSLIVALTRQAYAMSSSLASERGSTFKAIMDDWEQHKLEEQQPDLGG